MQYKIKKHLEFSSIPIQQKFLLKELKEIQNASNPGQINR